jgi:hypothetical protein
MYVLLFLICKFKFNFINNFKYFSFISLSLSSFFIYYSLGFSNSEQGVCFKSLTLEYSTLNSACGTFALIVTSPPFPVGVVLSQVFSYQLGNVYACKGRKKR